MGARTLPRSVPKVRILSCRNSGIVNSRTSGFLGFREVEKLYRGSANGFLGKARESHSNSKADVNGQSADQLGAKETLDTETFHALCDSFLLILFNHLKI